HHSGARLPPPPEACQIYRKSAGGARQGKGQGSFFSPQSTQGTQRTAFRGWGRGRRWVGDSGDSDASGDSAATGYGFLLSVCLQQIGEVAGTGGLRIRDTPALRPFSVCSVCSVVKRTPSSSFPRVL